MSNENLTYLEANTGIKKEEKKKEIRQKKDLNVSLKRTSCTKTKLKRSLKRSLKRDERFSERFSAHLNVIKTLRTFKLLTKTLDERFSEDLNVYLNDPERFSERFSSSVRKAFYDHHIFYPPSEIKDWFSDFFGFEIFETKTKLKRTERFSYVLAALKSKTVRAKMKEAIDLIEYIRFSDGLNQKLKRELRFSQRLSLDFLIMLGLVAEYDGVLHITSAWMLNEKHSSCDADQNRNEIL